MKTDHKASEAMKTLRTLRTTRRGMCALEMAGLVQLDNTKMAGVHAKTANPRWDEMSWTGLKYTHFKIDVYEHHIDRVSKILDHEGANYEVE